ncbi:MAG: hypothetical protein ITG02_11720 [Patulibacter sp.]|nr:hypothetical protein [Patulibacter sp.]
MIRRAARPAAWLVAVVGVSFGLAACGGDDQNETTTARTVAQTARELRFDLGGQAPFSANSPWNRTVETASVDPNSDRMIRLGAQSPVPVEEDERLNAVRNTRNLYINMDTTAWTPGVFRIGVGKPVRLVCRQVHCGRKADAVPSELVLPDDAVPDSGHDGWLILVDEEQRIVWDLWRSRRVGQTISYAFARRWSLTASGSGTPRSESYPRTPSLRGSGLPLIGGLIRPKELREGRIPHALAIAIPGPAASVYVPPATTTNGLQSPLSVPEGARLRLKANALARVQQGRKRQPGAVTIAQTLYTYGAIVVDRADSPTLYAQRNGDYKGLLTGSALRDLRLSDFEVLTLPRKITDPDAPPKASG